jgi:hypothetical protein
LSKLLLINERYKIDELIDKTFKLLKDEHDKLSDLFCKLRDKGGEMEKEDYEVETSIILEINNYENNLELYKKIDLILGQEINDFINRTQFII